MKLREVNKYFYWILDEATLDSLVLCNVEGIIRYLSKTLQSPKSWFPTSPCSWLLFKDPKETDIGVIGWSQSRFYTTFHFINAPTSTMDLFSQVTTNTRWKGDYDELVEHLRSMLNAGCSFYNTIKPSPTFNEALVTWSNSEKYKAIHKDKDYDIFTTQVPVMELPNQTIPLKISGSGSTWLARLESNSTLGIDSTLKACQDIAEPMVDITFVPKLKPVDGVIKLELSRDKHQLDEDHPKRNPHVYFVKLRNKTIEECFSFGLCTNAGYYWSFYSNPRGDAIAKQIIDDYMKSADISEYYVTERLLDRGYFIVNVWSRSGKYQYSVMPADKQGNIKWNFVFV